MVMLPVRRNSPVPRLCLFAARNIDASEELTFSYGDTSDKKVENSEVGKTSRFSYESLRTKCLCGSNVCTGYLPFDERLYDQ
jgi:histone-lysine N-methyltransferase SETMAR